MRRLRVLMTRQEIVRERLPGSTAVVVDTLLATTTLLAILENGARRVFPAESLEAAAELCARLDGRVLRGGEQDAERIEGYDLGPYPEEYAPEVVAGRDVVFVTTNGTRAIADASSARRVLVGCPRNAPALARHLEDSEEDSVYIVCAGSGGRFTLEDFLGAALIVGNMDAGSWRLNDAAWLALDLYGRLDDPLSVLRSGRTGRWFSENGHLDTLRFVAEVGASELVPEVRDGRLLAAGGAEVSTGGLARGREER
ncbi:putative 2-phosphosulfolactate phosphatase [Rubrobacter xylanophilus]|uniref:Probable 2-phosphosulfolactate phosphatase n=2 Tax=Rubrobacter xylanophilus TaxID=49319 RepID=A0A510HID3_9ACTN|nr:putative 2-phosphosulfolactate phosphatase [Rubrobacter xylanophilus]